MVEPTSYTEDVEMKWTQSDQEAVEATYSQETVGAVGSTRCGQEPAGTCGQESAQTCGQDGSAEQDGFRRLDEIEMDAWRSFLAASTSVTARLNRELEAGCGISMHEYEILVRLSEAPDHTLRMSTLAEHVSHSRSPPPPPPPPAPPAGGGGGGGGGGRGNFSKRRVGQAGLDFLCDAAPVHLDGVRRHVIDRLGQEQQLAMAELMKVIAQAPDSSASSVLSASSAS